MVENVYLSESGNELKVTMYPYGKESKHVYFMKLGETEFTKEDESQNMRIFDGNNDLEVVFDAELQPAKVSEGLEILTCGGDVNKKGVAP